MSDEVDVVEVVAEVEVAEAASVQKFPNSWHLVTFGSWQVSVSPDGMVRLPHSAMPETAPDLVEALRVAGEVGVAVRAENEAREAAAVRRPGPGIPNKGGVVVQAGSPPFGAMRLPVSQRTRKKGY